MKTNRFVAFCEKVPAVKTNPLIDEWVTTLAGEGKADRTIAERRRILANFQAHLDKPIETATRRDIAAWLGRPLIKAATRQSYHSVLRQFYGWVRAEGLIEDHPMNNIKPARRPKLMPHPCSQSQYRRLIDTGDLETRAMCLLAGLEGLRVHEIAMFHSSQVDHEAMTITVTGKGGHTYTLPAHHDVLEIARQMPRGYWFPSQRREHVGRQVIGQRIKLHMIKKQVPGVPHSLRHYFGTQLVARGADLRVAQELLRHQSLQTTAIYVQTTDERKRSAIDSLDWRDQP